MAKDVLAVIIGNRDFFPDVLVGEARKDLIRLLGELGIEAVMLTPEESKLGAVETWADAKRCGELFRKHAERISGILVCLPNFGDEKAVADSIRLSGLNVPILVQASPDDLDQFGLDRRRDAYCGKISVCNNLRQYGLRYTLTYDHTTAIWSEGFRRDVLRFLEVCRVRRGLHRDADWRSGRTAECFQHHALQREAAGAGGDQREHDRFVRGVWPRGGDGRKRCSRNGARCPDQELCGQFGCAA